ncbi:hypothetical protein RB653_007012 [Dictyostelium firmibasis]|uniref:Fucokinase n=1 Tax=Dictyostelium firmibasis TaxID=79012 RepID=A0AAN7TUS2_9MYCE
MNFQSYQHNYMGEEENLNGNGEEEIYWDAIAVTAPKFEHAEEFLKELQNRQNEGIISKKTFLISIPDPYINTGYEPMKTKNRSKSQEEQYEEDETFGEVPPHYQSNNNTSNNNNNNDNNDSNESNNQKRYHNHSIHNSKDNNGDEVENEVQHKPHYSKVGSGSSMINSLFVITEKLSALSGKSYLDVDILKNKRILLLLNGGIHQHAPLVNLCTKSFSMMPLKNIDILKRQNNKNYNNQEETEKPKRYVGDEPVYPIDILLSNLNEVVKNLHSGFMVSSTESLIFFNRDDSNLKSKTLWKQSGVSVITMNVGPDYYTNHGMCKINDESGEILEIAYKKPKEYLEGNGFISKESDTASIYTGIIFFCEKTTEKLLYLHNTSPLDSCTYLGVDSGSQLLKFGVFPDILCSMTKNETFESYLNQPYFYGSHKSLVKKARKVVWDLFRNTPIRSIKIQGSYYYLKNPSDYLSFIQTNINRNQDDDKNVISKKMHSFIACQDLPIKGIIVNSILTGKGKSFDTTVIYDSILTGDWSIGERSIVFGVKSLFETFYIRDNMIVTEIRLKSIKIKHSISESPKALIVLGVEDDLNSFYNDPSSRIANRNWEEFLLSSGVSPDELWSKGVPKILRTARLFPIIVDDQDEKMYDASLWIQNKESPPLSVIGRWRSSKRISVADIIGESYLLDYTQLEVKQQVQQLSDNKVGDGVLIVENLNNNNNNSSSCSSSRSNSSNNINDYDCKDSGNSNLNNSSENIYGISSNNVVDNIISNTARIKPCTSSFTLADEFSSKWMIEGDIQACFKWRREISFQVDSMEIEHILVQGIDQSILPFIKKWSDCKIPLSKALETLDRISLSCPLQYTGRLLSCISDTLAVYVNNQGGLRSGPARNCQFEKSYNYFRSHDERKGFLSLIKERRKWLTSYESMIRVARHYEGAGQIVIKNIVDTCPTELKPLDPSIYTICSKKDWVCVSLPVRIDLAGGWTDTPPICYEHGGVVLNAAIRIRGKKSIEARVRRLDEPVLIFRVGQTGDSIICRSLNDLMDYDQPHAPGSLLKSCFLQLGLIDYGDGINFANVSSVDGRKARTITTSTTTACVVVCKTLKQQLESLGGGMEVTSSSDLPTGSGLGTSSILAAGLITAMAYAFGYKYSDQHLFHAVLKVEQMLTTGGGWQDQIGGILGGFKEGSCTRFHSKNDKIMVTAKQLPMTDEIIQLINDHLLLVYTGRTRLARDLLQDVIRRWYAKTQEILLNTDALIQTATTMKEALIKGDIKEIGTCLLQYWNQKKAMAVGAEPTRITEIFNLVKDFTHGYSLAGAGGGGFMILITKDHCADTKNKLQEIIRKVDGFETVEIFDTEIDKNGLEISIEKHIEYLQVPPMNVTN